MRASLFLIALLGVASASSNAATTTTATPRMQLESATFDGMRIVDVLALYQARGFNFVYSKRLVRRRLRVVDEPPTGPAIDRLEFVLAAKGLRVAQTERAQWLITPMAPKERLVVRGQVVDDLTGIPVRGAVVSNGNRGTKTAADGSFALALARPRNNTDSTRVELQIARAGYAQGVQSVAALPVQGLRIKLYPLEPTIEELFVTSSRYALKHADNSALQLRDDELKNLPEVGDDALRAALHLPGMATLGLSAKPHIRGGSQDETLILFDNVELLEPFHLKDFQSLFSGLNPNLIKSIDVYTGGFPARYGDRMSGVMDIKPVTDYAELGGEVSLSLLSTSLSVHGPLAQGRGDWVVSGRRGNLDLVTEIVNPSLGEPAYSDWFTQFTLALDPGSELSGNLIYYVDDILFTDAEADDGETARSRYKNAYGWLKYARDWTGKISSVSVLSAGNIVHRRSGEVIDDEPDDSNAFSNDRRSFDLYSLQHTQTYSPRRTTQFELGGRLIYQRGRYDYQASVLRGELAQLLGTDTEVQRNIRLRPAGFSGGVYVSAIRRLGGRLMLEGGLRWDFQDYQASFDSQISPRFSARLDVTNNTRLRVSVGRFYQPEAIHELQIIDGFAEFQQAQRADHYIVSVTHDFGSSGFRIRAEGFYKHINNPKFRFENLFDELVLLPELAADRVLTAPEVARSRGLEFTLGYVRKRLSSFVSYTYGSAEDRLAGVWTPRRWDQTHTVSAGAFVDAGNWTLSASALWHSGWPATELPDFISEDEVLSLNRNDAKLPSYFSVDIRAERQWRRGRHEFALFAELTNALNHRNIGALEADLEEDEDAGGFVALQDPKRLLPLIPSIGFSWKF